MTLPKVDRIDPVRWRIPRTGGMRVDGLVFASAAMMREIQQDQSLQQVANVAHLPGIVGASVAMPDIHWGYGFPIGGVAATDAEDGVVSPGGVGYDINCGVRLLRTRLRREELTPAARVAIVSELFERIPCGVGEGRDDVHLGPETLRDCLAGGAGWAVEQGWGEPRDLEAIEAQGCLPEADPEAVSERALARGARQLGTLGSGNHFAELQYVSEIYDAAAAEAFGLAEEGIVLMIHSGSRGLGHQVCTDALQEMMPGMRRLDPPLPDRQLCCAPLRSPQGRRYLGAMSAAANFAFANRQVMTHWVRQSLATALGRPVAELGVEVVYDVCHNIAKMETVEVDGAERRVCVHRKGATRAYPPGHASLPDRYREVGQPVLIPGDMGRYSYVLAGTARAFAETFGSSCHGAGRRMSRHSAKKAARGRDLVDELAQRGVVVRARGRSTVAEEMPEAYKDVAEVVDVVTRAGISRKVAQLKPLGVIKG